MLKKIFAIALLSLCFSAIAADKIEPPTFDQDARNPPPTIALKAFQRFELRPVAMNAPWKGKSSNDEALVGLQNNVNLRANPIVEEWNAMPASEQARTLVIEPEITYVHFVTGGKRFFGGASLGDSVVVVKMRLTDATTGEVIAEPTFYQKANKFGAVFSYGATDKHMLIRISAMIADYLRSNYESPVGSFISIAPGHEAELGDK